MQTVTTMGETVVSQMQFHEIIDIQQFFVLSLIKKTVLTSSNAWNIFEAQLSFLIQNVFILSEKKIINQTDLCASLASRNQLKVNGKFD